MRTAFDVKLQGYRLQSVESHEFAASNNRKVISNRRVEKAASKAGYLPFRHWEET